MPFDRFMALALYHPQLGYYRTSRRRLGRHRETDFYTATTSGPFFGELVIGACIALLGKRDASKYSFVEIGAEPDFSALQEVVSPFRACQTVRVGQPLALTGPCVVFSNELFDAQPFRRFVVRNGHWREIGVQLQVSELVEVELGEVIETWLPTATTEGVRFDAPRDAVELLEEIVRQPWTGLFLAADYGKTFRELAEATPAGTARAYAKHVQSNALLSQPGEQDLTCHVCWDWLWDTLRAHRFAEPTVQSQESFFVHHAADVLASAFDSDSTVHNPRKQALMQLIHPGNLGQKFQVLHALRD